MAQNAMPLILLIEDDKIIRENTQELLTLNGYKCLTAANGSEGLTLAMNSSPDLILCDITLPIMNGYEIKSELNKVSNTAILPFIYLTAKSSNEDLRIGMNLGAADYIIKPFKIEELLNSIKRRLVQSNNFNKTVEVQVVNAVSDFISIAKHECNTPLNAIINFSEIIKNTGFDDFNSIGEMADCINFSGKRLHKTLNNLIDLARLQHYKTTTTKICENIDISENLRNVVSAQALRYNRIDDVTYNIEEINSNKFRKEDLTLLFTELTDNAFKFSTPGDEVKIDLSQPVQSGAINCAITNRIWSETGFALRDIAPFKQFEREYYEQQGSGLGLYLSKLICDYYGGNLKVDSSKIGVMHISASLS